MKKALCLLTLVAAVTSAYAQGPYGMSIGSGTGSLVINAASPNGIYATGWIRGDSATFDPGDATPNTTVWKSYWLLRNVTDDLNYYADDTTAHTTKIPNGTLANSATSITNDNFALGGTNQSGSLAITLSAPTAGDTARLHYAWTISNGDASAKTYRLIYHFDSDSYIGATNYNDDLVARAPSTMGGTWALGVGENDGSGNVNLNQGVLIDTDKPNSFFGMSNNSGPSNWWRNATGYVGIGMDVTHSIDPSVANTIENDADNNFLADSGRDSGGALQVDIVVPASGSETVNFSATWGLNQILSGDASVSDWSIY